MSKNLMPDIVQEWTIEVECSPEETPAVAEAIAKIANGMPQDKIDEAMETLQKLSPLVRQAVAAHTQRIQEK